MHHPGTQISSPVSAESAILRLVAIGDVSRWCQSPSNVDQLHVIARFRRIQKSVVPTAIREAIVRAAVHHGMPTLVEAALLVQLLPGSSSRHRQLTMATVMSTGGPTEVVGFCTPTTWSSPCPRIPSTVLGGVGRGRIERGKVNTARTFVRLWNCRRWKYVRHVIRFPLFGRDVQGCWFLRSRRQPPARPPAGSGSPTGGWTGAPGTISEVG